MLQTLKTIESFVAPVVMISANGLLCLAFYNRLAAIVHRVRTINKERFDLFSRLSAVAGQPRSSPESAHLEHRLEVLDELGHQLFGRVRLIRDSLVCLLITVLLMLLCSLVLGIAPLIPNWAWLAPTLFVAGVAVMMLGVARAIQELWMALSPLSFEHDMLERLQRENGREYSV
ncbi:MAG: DUF2721 domain-containing protein [Rhodopirellula sp.]|nr:DUF2721 domain-containing protein [Rhodopirellula sp.]